MLIFSDENLAKELGIPVRSLRRVMRRHPDFPKRKVSGVRSNVFDIEEIREWWKAYTPDAYYDELETLEQNKFVQLLGISRRLVLNWRNNGLQYKKLGNGTVLIYVDAAKDWFLNQNNPRTRAYAEKLPTKGIDQDVSK